MTTVSGSFSATGSSSILNIKRNEVVSYSVTGTATATILLEVDRFGGGSVWETVETLTAASNPSGSYSHVGDEARVRMTCSAYTSGTAGYSFNDADTSGTQTITDPFGNVLATPKESGLDFTAGKLSVAGTPVTATGAEINVLDDAAVSLTIGLAAGTVTDSMDITITVLDGASTAIDAVHEIEWWISEAATGIGLTADTYSGDVTAVTGTEWIEHTSKKHYTSLTDVNGVIVARAVASANPTDQYVAARHPLTGKVIVSSASGTNWEGAA